MNCPQCSNEMILAKATDFGAEYHYCRTCKKELSEMEKLGYDVSSTVLDKITNTFREDFDKDFEEALKLFNDLGVRTATPKDLDDKMSLSSPHPYFWLGCGGTNYFRLKTSSDGDKWTKIPNIL